MASQLKVAVLPHPIEYADPRRNLEAVETAVGNLDEGTDILVLPEMFTTGYVKNQEKLAALAEDNNGPTMSAVRALAASRNMAVCGSFLATDGGHRYFNRGFFTEPDGRTAIYDKRHLFSPGGEDEIYAPGTDVFRPVRFRGWNVALFICYDLRFPVWMRNVGLKYDLAIVPSNWAESRGYAFRQLAIARAIENQACLVAANRGGEDPYGTYPREMSEIFDWMGRHVGCQSDSGFTTAALSLDAMMEFRKRFAVSKDADSFTLNI